jgi:hypothetical protein
MGLMIQDPCRYEMHLIFDWIIHLTDLVKTIVKAECLSLVGAHVFRIPTIHSNGSRTSHKKHTLPHPIKFGEPQRYTADGQLLHSPDWDRSPSYNGSFIDAVVASVSAIKVSSSMIFGTFFTTNSKL